MSGKIEVRIARTETGEVLSFPVQLKDGSYIQKWMYEIVNFEDLSDEILEGIKSANNGYHPAGGLIGLLDIMFIDPSEDGAKGFLVYGVSPKTGKGYFVPDDAKEKALSAYERYLASRK